MFERMEIAEIIYEGVVTPSYKKTTWTEANCTGLNRNKRGKSTSSNTNPMKDGSAEKRRKRYVDNPKSTSKIYMIHGSGHSSDECKALGEFGTKYTAAQPTKYRGRNPIPIKRFHKKQENHNIINNTNCCQSRGTRICGKRLL